MSNEVISRRTYLRLSVLGTAAIGAATLWTGCGGEKKQTLSCTDETGLSDAEKAGRKAMQYVDASPHADKTCANCSLFQAPSQPGSCGGCTVLKGPIHPQGHCTAWAAAPAS